MSRPLLAVDGDSFAHRAYHALPKTIRRRGNKGGGAIVGFANFLLRLYESERPRAVLVAWDTLEAPTYRHKAFPAYQSGREFDSELCDQLEILPQFVTTCGFACAKSAGFEAADFLAAAVASEERRGGTAIVATGDRDAFQLASKKTTILQPVRAGEMARIGPSEVRERYGVEPGQVPDFIALRGDPLDKLPGAKSVRPKGAAIVNNIPVFICDERSAFAVADYQPSGRPFEGASYYRSAMDQLGFVRRVERSFAKWLASFGTNLARPSYQDAISRVAKGHEDKVRVLVIRSGGISYDAAAVDTVCTDVAFGPHVDAIADAHDLPFRDGYFDLVIAEAVLEHVADPQRCVAEVWRILKPNGLVFAVTPFMQPVYAGAYDFTRFTPMGHRRLFRYFDTVEEGMAMGAGSMLAYALSGFLVSISGNRLYRNAAKLVGLMLTVPLRKLDRFLSTLPSRDNAGGCFFIGRRRDTAIPDRQLIREYRGRF